jgi:RNA polymerase sigma-70 factor (ECF subfamily)
LVQRLESEREQAPSGDPADVLHDQDPDLAVALAGLPPADREILRLWAWEQLEPREIAHVLGSTANAVSLRLSRARKKLAESLTRQDDSTPGHIGDERAEEQQR